MRGQIVTISALVDASPKKTWDYYTEPKHITQWNFASDDWQCPSASNDLRPGGELKTRMEAKDGSAGFNLEAMYTEVDPPRRLEYILADGRKVITTFSPENKKTKVTTQFETEFQNPADMQRHGWQSILNNFKKCVEASK